MALSCTSGPAVDWVTFVGSGEPLLHSRIGEMIRGVKQLTEVPVAVITNGSLLSDPGVREELMEADAVLPSVDAGTADLFRKVNRPFPSISIEDHAQGLAAFSEKFSGKLLVEVMLVKGLNDTRTALVQTAKLIEGIQPDEIHISLPERPPAESWVKPSDMEGIRLASEILGGVGKVYSPEDGILVLEDEELAVEMLVAVIGRHPLSQEQVIASLKSHPSETRERILGKLQSSPKAKLIRRHGKRFWVPSDAQFDKKKIKYVETKR
jgi:wyosine [tRNA(Phe)-imidazoG37] synthetase (radical SAM superfamily)